MRFKRALLFCLALGLLLVVVGCGKEQAYVTIEDDVLVRYAGNGERYLCLVALHRTKEFDETTLDNLFTYSGEPRRKLIMPTAKDIAEKWGGYNLSKRKSMVVLEVPVKKTESGFRTVGKLGYNPLPGFKLYIIDQDAHWRLPSWEIVIRGGTIENDP